MSGTKQGGGFDPAGRTPRVTRAVERPRSGRTPGRGRGAVGQGEKPVAILLAAGASRRMGTPKALLKLDGRTFLESCARAFEKVGIAPLVVLGADAELIAAAHPRLRWVRNHEWPRGQLSSVRTGLRAALAQGATSLYVHPVDAPRLHWSTAATLRETLFQGHPVAVPVHGKLLGHPLALVPWAAKVVLDSEAPTLWDAVLPLHPRRVKVQDGGAFDNINDPAQYQKVSQGVRR